MAKVSNALEICNLALLMIGQHTIPSLDENGDSDTLQAETCRAFYDQARMSLLSRYNWTFALSRFKYGETKYDSSENRKKDREKYLSKNEIEYNYKYQLPHDFLKLVSVKDGENKDLLPITGCKPPYSLEGVSLFCDTFPCRILYVHDVENVLHFSSMFIDCLVLELATRLTKIFNDSTTYKQQLEIDFARLIDEAKRLDCQQIMLDSIKSYPMLFSTLGDF